MSIEPHPTLHLIKQDITELFEFVSFADKIIFGWKNYSTKITTYEDVIHSMSKGGN